MDAITTLLAVVCVGFLAPIVLNLLNTRARHREKVEEYKRQDLVAARVADAAKQAEKAAQLLLEDNRRVASQAARTGERMFGSLTYLTQQTDRIHALVNSNLTEAQQREMDATTTMLVTMREVMDLKQRQGIEPTPETLAVLDNVEARIAAMSTALDHKRDQTAIADAQARDAPQVSS